MDNSGYILIVDDEPDLREIMQFNLEKAGYAVKCAASAEEALKILSPDCMLILLDVMLGGISGFKMAQVVRKDRGSDIPIIFLTAKGAEADMLRGFSTGGDDYISKPFSINEVMARIKAVLRRSASSPQPKSDPNVIESGKIRIDLAQKMVYADGAPVVLSKKEFEILSLLAKNEGRIFSREDLISELWKDAPYVLDRTVDVHIARIRGKLGPLKNYLTNRSGYGYSFKSLEHS
ncbi:MAG: response regulator transcription factor [Bacteroidales bacterium]|nr:response regulator transcription factor [Bacteroidales bacterium]